MNEQLQHTFEFLDRLTAFMGEKAMESNEVQSPRDVIEVVQQSAGLVSTFIFNTIATEEVIAQGFVLNAFFDALYEDREMLEQNPNLFMQTVANKAKLAVIGHKKMLEEADKQQRRINYIDPPEDGGRRH